MEPLERKEIDKNLGIRVCDVISLSSSIHHRNIADSDAAYTSTTFVDTRRPRSVYTHVIVAVVVVVVVG